MLVVVVIKFTLGNFIAVPENLIITITSCTRIDPDAASVDASFHLIDTCLRVILCTLLGDSDDSARPTAATGSATQSRFTTLDLDSVYEVNLSAEDKQVVIKCLLYLRDRIGVPRDLSIHGAKQFRAHINHFLHRYYSML